MQLCTLTALLCSVLMAQSFDPAEVNKEISVGKASLERGIVDDARKHFEKASTLANRTSAEAFRWLGFTALQSGDYKEAHKNSARAMPLAASDSERARLHNLNGVIALTQFNLNAQKKELIQEAETEFRLAVKLDPEFAAPVFNLGLAVLKQGRDLEGVEFLKTYLGGTDRDHAMLATARRLIVKPSLARADLAPGFVVKDVNGNACSSETLHGKVAVLDFWATWCQSCIAQLPALRRLVARLPAEQFTLLSLSEDSDMDIWQKFIAKEQPSWTNCFDLNGALYRSFRLGSMYSYPIPSFVLLDRDGVVLRRYSGMDDLSGVEQDIARTLKSNGTEKSNGTDFRPDPLR